MGNSRLQDFYISWYGLVLAIVCASTSWNVQAQCSKQQTDSFTAQCQQIGAYFANLEATCVAWMGSHYACGYYPLPSQVVPIPEGLGCRVTLLYPPAISYPHPGCMANPPASNVCWTSDTMAKQECDNYTITIEPANPLSTLAQNGLTVEPESMLALKAVVKNQSGVAKADVKVDLKVEVKANTGGHDHHDTNRPKGDVTCAPLFSGCGSGSVTDSNGELAFIFLSPAPAGEHTITATCDLCSSPATADVKVMVDGLSQIPASPFYTLNETTGEVIGARAGWHTDNHNLNAAAQAALLVLAEDYHRIYPKDPVLHLNDASLPWGGVYDICARPGACAVEGVQEWVAPHEEHRRGTVVDIRANDATGAIPPNNRVEFQNRLRRKFKKMSYLHESKGTLNEHYHIRLLGRSE